MSVQMIIALVIIVLAAGVAIYNFVRLTKEQKINNIKEWLKWAVTIAEKDLGSGTGQLKLRQVYNMAVTQFPWIVQLVTFEQFSIWVDEALKWMDNQISKNQAVSTFINE